MNEPASRIRLGSIVIFYSVMAALAWGIRGWYDGEPPFAMPDAERAPLWQSALLAIVAALAVHGGTGWVERNVAWARELPAAMVEMIGRPTLLQAGLYSLLSGVGEELLFRGALQPVMGAFASTLVFGLLHVGPDRRYLPWTVMATGFGGVAAALTWWTGDITAAILAHMTVNYLGFVRLSEQEA